MISQPSSAAGRVAVVQAANGERTVAPRQRRRREEALARRYVLDLPLLGLRAGQVELEQRETLGVDERIDRGDPAARDGEAHHGEQSAA